MRQALKKVKAHATVMKQLPLAREALAALEAAAAIAAPGVCLVYLKILRHFFPPFLVLWCVLFFFQIHRPPSQSAAAAGQLDAAALQKQRAVQKKQLAAASSTVNGLDGHANNLLDEVIATSCTCACRLLSSSTF